MKILTFRIGNWAVSGYKASACTCFQMGCKRLPSPQFLPDLSTDHLILCHTQWSGWWS